MVVREWTTAAGTRITIMDDAYAGCGPEELERRRAMARQTAWWCAARAAERKGKQSAPTAADREGALPGAAFEEAAAEKDIGDVFIIARKGGDCNG